MANTVQRTRDIIGGLSPNALSLIDTKLINPYGREVQFMALFDALQKDGMDMAVLRETIEQADRPPRRLMFALNKMDAKEVDEDAEAMEVEEEEEDLEDISIAEAVVAINQQADKNLKRLEGIIWKLLGGVDKSLARAQDRVAELPAVPRASGHLALPQAATSSHLTPPLVVEPRRLMSMAEALATLPR